MKIGFFGGCFNPPTIAHIELAKKALAECNLDKVIFVPIGDFYKKKELAPARDRYNMLKIACEDIDRIEVSDIELDIYLKFVEFTKGTMNHPEWLGEFTKGEYVKMLLHDASIYVWTFYENMNQIFTDISQFVACGMLIPATKRNLTKFNQKDLDFKEVIDFGPQLVHPDYIGNGLQMDIIDYLELIAKGQGYKYCLSTIDPENVFSLRNFLKKDFEISSRVELKRGTRLVLVKKISSN